jgi:hypothetical protein
MLHKILLYILPSKSSLILVELKLHLAKIVQKININGENWISSINNPNILKISNFEKSFLSYNDPHISLDLKWPNCGPPKIFVAPVTNF